MQVIVGTIGRPQGLRGEVTVRPRTDQIETRFAAGAVLVAEGRTLTVVTHSMVQGKLVVAFDGVADRASAEALRGVELWVDSTEDALADGEYHDASLIGLPVVTPDGEAVGTIAAVEHPPAQDLLVVRTAHGNRLVPFVTELVPNVDLAQGRVVIVPIPGLLSEVPDED